MAYMSTQKWPLQASVSRSLLRAKVCMQEFLPPPQLRMYTLPVLHAVSRTNTIAVTLFSRRLLCCPQYHPVSSHLYLHPLLVQLTTDLLSSPDSLQTRTYVDIHIRTSIGILQFVSVSLPRSWLSPPSYSLYQVYIDVYFTYLYTHVLHLLVYACTSPTCLSILYRGVQGTSLGTCCLYMTIKYIRTYIRTYYM